MLDGSMCHHPFKGSWHMANLLVLDVDVVSDSVGKILNWTKNITYEVLALLLIG